MAAILQKERMFWRGVWAPGGSEKCPGPPPAGGFRVEMLPDGLVLTLAVVMAAGFGFLLGRWG